MAFIFAPIVGVLAATGNIYYVKGGQLKTYSKAARIFLVIWSVGWAVRVGKAIASDDTKVEVACSMTTDIRLQFLCSLKHVAGASKAKVCWDVVAACGNGGNMTGHACQEIDPGQTSLNVIDEDQIVDSNCHGVTGLAVKNMVVTDVKFTGSRMTPGLSADERRRRSGEAAALLNKLWAGSLVYYETDHMDEHLVVTPKQFPGTVGLTPATDCCAQPGGMCRPDPADWQQPVWQALGFDITSPHRFRVEYKSSGNGKEATFTARAVGDIDCNGVTSTWERLGRIDQGGDITGTTAPNVINEGE